MPTSYQAPRRNAPTDARSHSQDPDSVLKVGSGTAAKILDRKGRDVFTIRPAETLARAVEILHEKRIGALMVTDQNGALCGILSERDIIRTLAARPDHSLPHLVKEAMTTEVETCAPDDTLAAILLRMSKGRFRHMPVQNGSALEGMISIGDAVSYRLLELEHEALQLKQLVVG